MKTSKAAIAAAFALCAGLSSAAPISWELVLSQGPTTYVGTFSVDDSLATPNAFVTFSDFLSFSVTIGAETYTLANAFRPADEGLIFDAAGDPLRFDDPAGSFTEFCSAACVSFPALAFADGTNNWQLVQGGDVRGTYAFRTGGTVPEPSALSLLGLGLLALGIRRRAHKA